MKRTEDEARGRAHLIWRQTEFIGYRLKTKWSSPFAWIAANQGAVAPIWLHPSTEIELWEAQAKPPRVVFRRPEESNLYETSGDPSYREWRRVV